jgi:hypothetical protein
MPRRPNSFAAARVNKVALALVSNIESKSFGRIDNGFAQHLAGVIEGDIDVTEAVFRGLEQSRAIGWLAQIARYRKRISPLIIDGPDRGVGVGLAGSTVVMHHDFRAALREFAADESAQVLGARTDDYDFPFASG